MVNNSFFSKGLLFSTVLLASCGKGLFPSVYYSDKSESETPVEMAPTPVTGQGNCSLILYKKRAGDPEGQWSERVYKFEYQTGNFSKKFENVKIQLVPTTSGAIGTYIYLSFENGAVFETFEKNIGGYVFLKVNFEKTETRLICSPR